MDLKKPKTGHSIMKIAPGHSVFWALSGTGDSFARALSQSALSRWIKFVSILDIPTEQVLWKLNEKLYFYGVAQAKLSFGLAWSWQLLLINLLYCKTFAAQRSFNIQLQFASPQCRGKKPNGCLGFNDGDWGRPPSYAMDPHCWLKSQCFVKIYVWT
jgi:hypothetical protein